MTLDTVDSEFRSRALSAPPSISPVTLKHCAWLVLAVAVTRFSFRTKVPFFLDTVNFILGIDDFDPQRQQPHAPGYYLYVQTARLLRLVWSDRHSALVALSILASCGTAVLIYLLTERWFGRPAALFAGLIFVASPLCWFHGGVALVYIVEMLLSAIVGLLCWHNIRTNGAAAVPSAIALGAAAGMRQSSIAFLAPLWLYSLHKARFPRAAIAGCVLGVTCLAWMVPLAWSSGGIEGYWAMLSRHWNRVHVAELAVSTSFFSTVMETAIRASWIVAIYVSIFAAAAPLLYVRKLPKEFDRSKRIFTALWIAPGLLFFTFGFLRLLNSGFLLLLAPPLFAVLGAQADAWYQQAAGSPRARLSAVGAFAVFNLLVFLFAPVYFGYFHVKEITNDGRKFQSALRQVALPETTVILAFDDLIDGFRIAGYYLPEYLTVEVTEALVFHGGPVNSMHDRTTQILPSLPAHYTRFVLYPPHPKLEQMQNFQLFRDCFPPGVLHTANKGDYNLVVGDLRLLRTARGREGRN